MSLIQSVSVSPGDFVLAQDHNDNVVDIVTNAGDYVVTAGTQPNYTATVTSEFLLVDGAKVRLNIHATNSGGAVTLNVNATGADAVIKPDGSAVADGELLAGSIYEFVHNGTEWQVVGIASSGGGTREIDNIVYIDSLVEEFDADGTTNTLTYNEWREVETWDDGAIVRTVTRDSEGYITSILE